MGLHQTIDLLIAFVASCLLQRRAAKEQQTWAKHRDQTKGWLYHICILVSLPDTYSLKQKYHHSNHSTHILQACHPRNAFRIRDLPWPWLIPFRLWWSFPNFWENHETKTPDGAWSLCSECISLVTGRWISSINSDRISFSTGFTWR